MKKQFLALMLCGCGISALHAQFVSTTNTDLGFTESLVVDPEGNRYVADRDAHRVLMLDTDNTPTVYCNIGLNVPTGMVRAPSGEIYVVNYGNGTVSVIPPGGGAPTVYAIGFSSPRGITMDVEGNLYVGEYGTRRIYKVTPGGGAVGGPNVILVVNSVAANGVLEHLAMEPTGNVVAAIGIGSQVPGVYRVQLPSGTPSLLATSPLLSSAFALHVNQNTGNIYVSAVYGHRILSLTPDGILSVLTGDGTNATLDGPLDVARFSDPSGITVDPAGNIWICQFGGAVRRIGMQAAEVPVDGLRLWLRADRGLLRSGDAVTQWLDQSGNAYHATPTGTLGTPQPPAFVANEVNGHPVVRFNGVNTGLSTPPFPAFPAKRGTMFTVSRVAGPSGTSGVGYGTIVGSYYAPSGTTFQFGSFPGTYGYYDGVGTSNFNVAANPPETWGITTFVRDSDTGFNFYKSGIPVVSGALNNNQPSVLPLHIGWCDFISPGGWEVLNGDIAEVLMYDGALSPEELEQVHTYLADKYTFNGDVPLPTAQDVSICGAGSATLTATGGDAYRWYDSPDGTVPLSTEAIFVTPVLTTTTTFYVANFNGQLQSQRVPVTVTVMYPGDACDDGDPQTTNDLLDANCACAGQPPYQDIDLALNLNGASQHVSTLANPITIGPAITVEAWIKPAAFNFGEIYSLCDDPNSACSGQDYKTLILRVDPGGAVTAGITHTQWGGRRVAKTSIPVLALNQWVHVAATMDLATNEGHIYFNGVEVPTIDGTAGTGSGSFAGSPAIGALQVSGAVSEIQYPYAGQIDELRVWNIVLPASSIDQYHCLKNVTGHPQTANLVAHYQIEDGSPPDEVVVDVAGGNNGVLANVSVANAYVPSEAECICPLGPVGSTCDDGDPNTINDVIAADCSCAGTPISGSIQVLLELRTDANSHHASWEIINELDEVVCSGGGYLPGITDPIVESCELSEGCYRLRVMDSFGDGFTAAGGYQLRLAGVGPGNRRIIDNFSNGEFGFESAISDQEGFCLPLGSDRPIHTSCDRDWWQSGNFLVATENVTVSEAYGVSNADSGYEFWFFEPNGGLNFRTLRTHAAAVGASFNPPSIRACHVQLNNWAVASHLQNNVLYNVRIRGVVAGDPLEEFGPACRVVLDDDLAACPPTGLNDIPGHPNFSCGVNRTFGGPNSAANRLYARAIAGANRYEFEFSNAVEGYLFSRFSNNVQRHLNWPGTAGPPLNVGSTYQVRVRASKTNGASWCAWGWLCDVTIDPAAAPGQENMSMEDGSSELVLWPNPNNGDQLWLSIPVFPSEAKEVAVDIYDLSGKRIMAREGATQDDHLYTTLNLDGIAAGTYVVVVTAGEERYTKRLVVQR